MNASSPAPGPTRSVKSPLLSRWLTRERQDLDPWLAAMNGIALTFLLTAVAGAGAAKTSPPPPLLPAPAAETIDSVAMELPAPPTAAASAPAETPLPPEAAESAENEPVPEILEVPPWRELPEMIEAVEVVEPVPPAPVPRPPRATRPSTPQPPAPSAKPNASPRSSGAATAPRSATGSVSGGGNGSAARSGPPGRGTTPQPPYPAFARRDRLQGNVVVRISVVNGAVSDVRVISGSGSAALDAYAVSHVRKRWKWPAGTTSTFTQPFRFVLR